MFLGLPRPQTLTPATFSGQQTKFTLKSFPPACTAPFRPSLLAQSSSACTFALSFSHFVHKFPTVPRNCARAYSHPSLVSSYELSIGFYSRSKPSITVSVPRVRSYRTRASCNSIPAGACQQRTCDDSHRLHNSQERQRAVGRCAQALCGEAMLATWLRHGESGRGVGVVVKWGQVLLE